MSIIPRLRNLPLGTELTTNPLPHPRAVPFTFNLFWLAKERQVSERQVALVQTYLERVKITQFWVLPMGFKKRLPVLTVGWNKIAQSYFQGKYPNYVDSLGT